MFTRGISLTHRFQSVLKILKCQRIFALTIEDWQLLNLLYQLLLHVERVGGLVLEVLRRDPPGLLSQVLADVPPVGVVPFKNVDLQYGK